MSTDRPVIGEIYYAPIALFSTVPLLFGERRGIVVNTPSQDVAVVYTTREAADAALADPIVWSPSNAQRARVARLRYRGLLAGTARLDFATDAERDAHRSAATEVRR